MEKTDASEWETVRLRSATLAKLRRYSELSLAPIGGLVGRAVELWTEQELPELMKPFESKD